jgi:hypothetical protein
MRRDAIEDQQDMGDEEAEKDRQQDRDRLPHTAQVQMEEQQHQPQRGPQFEACVATGSMLKTASVPLATEIAMVRM